VALPSECRARRPARRPMRRWCSPRRSTGCG
jgi:hypothetical protein